MSDTSNPYQGKGGAYVADPKTGDVSPAKVEEQPAPVASDETPTTAARASKTRADKE